MRHLQNFVISFGAFPLAVSTAFLFVFFVPIMLTGSENMGKAFVGVAAFGWGIGAFVGLIRFSKKLFEGLN